MTAYGERPRLRGVTHRYMCFVAFAAGAVLVAAAPADRRLVCAIYAVLLTAMFGVSAILHVGGWGPRAYGWLRRLDHATIFLCIAGTYTPCVALGLGAAGDRLLALAWIVCGLGVARALAWPHAPRAITATAYVAAGWVAVSEVRTLAAALPAATIALLLAGGALYTVGAVIYLVRRPDPWPATFGFHEIFHALVVAAAVCHFAAVTGLALA